MGLSCECDGDIYDYAWMFKPSDFYPFNEHGEYKRRVRCASCGKLIDFGSDCVRFDRIRAPRGEYEENRFPEGVPLASIYHCDDCASIFMNLWKLGFCNISPDVPVREHLEEYWEMTGFKPQGEVANVD